MTIIENKNVPVLRFPEFDKKWELKKLGEYLEFKNGINATKEQYGKGIKFINVLDIIENDFITYDKIIGSVDINEKEIAKNEVKYGDILFQRSSETRVEVGQANVYLDKKENAVFGGFVIRGQMVKEYHPIFFNFLLKTSFVRKEITTKSGGSTRYNVGQAILRDVNIVLPEILEQQKIANFLTAIDTKIQKLTKQKTQLETYKRGVIQQIFTQEIRFRNEKGEAFEEWTKKKLKDVSLKYFQGINTTADKIKYVKKGYPILQAKHITNEKIEFRNAKLISVMDYERYKEKFKPRINQLLISNIGTLGKIVRVKENEDYLIAWNIFKITLDTQLIEPSFAEYATKYNTMKGFFERMKTGNATKFVNKEDLLSMKINLPSLPEQQKIATFLSAIDKNINQVDDQLNQTQFFKKGLLQKMFV